MAALNVQVGYPIVPLSELIPVEEFSDTISTMSRYLPKIMVEAGIVSSTSEVRRNRPDLCKMYPDDMTTCEEIKWGKKRLYVVVGKKPQQISMTSGKMMRMYILGNIMIILMKYIQIQIISSQIIQKLNHIGESPL